MSALFFACEEPTDLGAELNPLNDKVETHYVELPVEVSQIKVDSIRSAYSTGNTSIFIGKTDSDEFGEHTASAYFNLFLPELNGSTIDDGAAFTSATLHVVYGSQPFGSPIGAQQSLILYQLDQAIPYTSISEVNDSTVALNYDYTTNQPARPTTKVLGNRIFTINNVLQRENPDSSLAPINRRVSIPIEGSFGEQIFNYINNNSSGTFDQGEFNKLVKGLALVPGSDNTVINEYQFASSESKLVLKYKLGVETDSVILPLVASSNRKEVDTLYNSFPIYYSVESNFAGTPLAIAATTGSRQEFNSTDGKIYYAPFLGVYPKFNFEDSFLNLTQADTNDFIVINRAFLELDDITKPTLKEYIPATIGFYPVEANNRRFVSANFQGFERSLSSRRLQYKVGETSIDQYQADLVYLLEMYQRTGNARYLNGIYYPENTVYDLSRFSATPDQLKLKVWYTDFKN